MPDVLCSVDAFTLQFFVSINVPLRTDNLVGIVICGKRLKVFRVSKNLLQKSC